MKGNTHTIGQNFLPVIGIRLLIGLLCLLGFLRPVFGSGSATFEPLTVEDGLSQSTIFTILQDSRGYMWFGTDDGLDRYNGYNFKVYKSFPQDSNSLSNTRINAVTEDTAGNIWVGTASGLDRLDPSTGEIKHYPQIFGENISNYITDLYFQDGYLWIATAYGLHLYDVAQDTAAFYIEDYSDLEISRLRQIYRFDERTLLITSQKGARFFNTKFRTFTSPETELKGFFQQAEQKVVSSVLKTNDGDWWLGTYDGLYVWDAKEHKTRYYTSDSGNPGTLSRIKVTNLFQDRGGTVWVGTNWGLNRYNKTTDDFTSYYHRDGNDYSLSSNFITCIYENRSGILWFGTYHNGVNKYVPSKQAFKTYNSLVNDHGQTLIDKNVITMTYLDNGDLWLGTFSGLFIIKNVQTDESELQSFTLQNSTLNREFIRCIYQDSEGIIWISGYGTAQPHLYAYNLKTGTYKVYSPDSDHSGGIGDAYVTDILEDHNGTLWFGTEGDGLARFNRTTDHFKYYKTGYSDPSEISGNWISNIFEDHLNTLWIATDNGLSRYNPQSETFTTLPVRPQDPTGLSAARTTVIFEDSDSTLWVGTTGGLNAYDYTTGNFQVFTQQDGLQSSVIWGVQEANDGTIWISTARGIAQYRKSTQSFTTFGSSEGVIITEFNATSFTQSSDGMLFFGGRKGLIGFKPEQVTLPKIKPSVIIARFQVLGESVPISKAHDITLKFQQRFFSFEFAALDYTSPHDNQYAYYLEGLDDDWHFARSRRYANYTNVNPGKYIFHAKGANAWGNWNEATPVHITVVPPYWQTAWFRLIASISILGIVGFIYIYRIRQIAKRERELEKQVSIRTRQVQRQKQQIQRAKEALVEEKERLSVTLHSIGDGVITADVDGKITLLNGVAENLTGWSHQEAVGKPFHEIFNIIHEHTRKTQPNPVTQVLKTESIIELASNTVLLSRDGEERLITDSGAPIRDHQGQIIGVVLVFRDITKERRMEEEIQKSEKLQSVGILAGGIAHDFNNILAVITGNLSLSKLRHQDEKQVAKYIQTAEEAAWQAKELTQQLLTLSKGGEPIRQVTSIETSVREGIDYALRGSDSTCKIRTAEDIQAVEIDPGQISQVIKNLILNADEAMKENGEIEVNIRNQEIGKRSDIPLPAGSYIRIDVIDHGVGIPSEYLEKIFDPYFSRKPDSSGLGLSIAHSIIKKHDGIITVNSEPESQTTFSLILPAVQSATAQAATKTPEVEEENTIQPDVVGGRILAMDDEDGLRSLLYEMLTFLGYEVTTVPNGEEAIETYRETLEKNEPYDAVILDLTIRGGMGGKDTIEHLRQIDPQVKAIVSSGYSNDPIMANYEEYGFSAMVPKPYKLEEMRDSLSTLIHPQPGPHQYVS